MKNKCINFIAVAAITINMSSVWAEESMSPANKEMGAMQGMDHSQMNDDPKPSSSDAMQDVISPYQGSEMKGMDMGSMSMQGGSPPADARDPHAYSGGFDFGPYDLKLVDRINMGSILVDRLESVITSNNTSATYDIQAWYGRDYDRAVLKAEGNVDNGKLQEATTELLWGHSIATFWDTQLGMRYDSGVEGPDRTWLAVGVQGLAPYWFEVDAAVYIGDEGRSALSLESEYELLLTQKWILQPRIEAAAYGKRDPERGIGSGLSELSAGIRLRYEFRREFAPYIGVEWAQRFGETKDFARIAGNDPSETRYVAGLRFWY